VSNFKDGMGRYISVTHTRQGALHKFCTLGKGRDTGVTLYAGGVTDASHSMQGAFVAQVSHSRHGA
jgi:hypothetical protein